MELPNKMTRHPRHKATKDRIRFLSLINHLHTCSDMHRAVVERVRALKFFLREIEKITITFLVIASWHACILLVITSSADTSLVDSSSFFVTVDGETEDVVLAALAVASGFFGSDFTVTAAANVSAFRMKERAVYILDNSRGSALDSGSWQMLASSYPHPTVMGLLDSSCLNQLMCRCRSLRAAQQVQSQTSPAKKLRWVSLY